MTSPSRPIPTVNTDALALALELAQTLDDEPSLSFYTKLAASWSSREWGTSMSRELARKLLITKAKQLAAQRAPNGYVRNPAAVFAAWVKKLDESPSWNPRGFGAGFGSTPPNRATR